MSENPDVIGSRAREKSVSSRRPRQVRNSGVVGRSALSPSSRRAAVIPRDNARPPAVRRPAAWFACDIIGFGGDESRAGALVVPSGSIRAPAAAARMIVVASTQLLLICASSTNTALIECGDHSFRGGKREPDCESASSFTDIAVSPLWIVHCTQLPRVAVRPCVGARTRPAVAQSECDRYAEHYEHLHSD
ncbi:hypothetical protein ACVWW1_000610 [Bradyrhizobium sp. JR3.5]